MKAALFAVVLAGCYSPSFDTCSLACAAEDKCPSGYACSMGRCAVEGTSCSPDAATDTNAPGCGDGNPMEDEVCFKTPLVIDTGAANIFDTQFIDGNGDGMADLAFLDNTTYLFRWWDGTRFDANSTEGPSALGANRMRGANLDGNMRPELIHNVPSAGTVEVLRWTGTAWMVTSATSEPSDARAIAVGKVSASAQRSIILVFPTRLRAYQQASSTTIAPLAQAGTGVPITGGRDVAVGDFNNDDIQEIVVADDSGIEVFSAIGNNLVKVTSPSIGMPVDAVATCNVDGLGTTDIVYGIRANGATSGRVGIARFNPQTLMFELPSPRLIAGMFSSLECADLDNDGRADAIVAANGGGGMNVLVLRGRSDGTFEPEREFPAPIAFSGLRANDDFNKDSVTDIVLTSSATGRITVLESNP